MKKKGLVILVLVIAVGGVIWSLDSSSSPKVNQGSKVIHLIIKDEVKDEVLYDEEISSDAVNLGELLIENQESLQLVYQEGEYGMFIAGLMGHESDQQAYWVYESKNNTSCVEKGYCDAADRLSIEDGNEFVFKLTKDF